jgi:hypothetical protein
MVFAGQPETMWLLSQELKELNKEQAVMKEIPTTVYCSFS